MIITCPECTTRYDVDDERFSPNGRSVRCSTCGESWFVPAPELLDMEPLDDAVAPRKRASRLEDDRRARRGDQSRAGTDASNRDARANQIRNSLRDDAFHDEDEDEDDSLFDAPHLKNDGKREPGNGVDTHRDRKKGYGANHDEEDEEPAPRGWRKGRQFIVEDEESDAEPRSFFPRRRNDKKEDEKSRDDRRDSLRFADEEDDARSAKAGSHDRQERAFQGGEEDAVNVVDADWEDINEAGEDAQRGFGRRIRAERRRATALARMEDVRPLDPDAFDEEFFTALRVTPRELERAIRKARRRAEAREKNRLTPLRVIGWTAWLAVVAGAIYAAVVYRDDIVKIAPRAADAYAVIGIEANPYGLSIENVSHRLAMSTAGPMIEITGNLRNKTDESVTAPLLQAEALGPQGELLARWTFSASEAEVGEGAAVSFITRMPAPEEVSEVALSFAPSKSVLDSLLQSRG